MNQVGLWMFWQPHQKVKIQWPAKNLNPRFVTISNLGYWEIKCLKSINHTTVNRTNQKDRLLHPSKVSGHILQNGDAIHLGISGFFRIISTIWWRLMGLSKFSFDRIFWNAGSQEKIGSAAVTRRVIFSDNLEEKMQQIFTVDIKLKLTVSTDWAPWQSANKDDLRNSFYLLLLILAIPLSFSHRHSVEKLKSELCLANEEAFFEITTLAVG